MNRKEDSIKMDVKEMKWERTDYNLPG